MTTNATEATATSVMPDFTEQEFFRTSVQLLEASRQVSDAYLMSLTALICGLDVRFYKSQNAAGTSISHFWPKYVSPEFYTLSDGKRSFPFWASGSNFTTSPAGALETRDKVRSKPLLHKAGLNTPAGGAAAARNLSVLEKLGEAGVTRVLVKPAQGSLAKGIQANISLDEAREHILANPKAIFVVEQFIQGVEVRAYTIEDEVIYASVRLPKHVIGDGTNTLLSLIEAKMRRQRSNPRSYGSAMDPREITSFLREKKWNPDAIPKRGEFVRLTDAQYWQSIDSIECTPSLEPEIREAAVRAARVFGLKFAGVDLIKSKTGKVFVIEVNAKPGIYASAFPLYTPWNLRLPEAILRVHFPHLKAEPRRIKSYDFIQLFKDYKAMPEDKAIVAADYVQYA